MSREIKINDGYKQFEAVEKRKCLWDDIPETSPGSGIKLAGLVCPCPKCSWKC